MDGGVIFFALIFIAFFLAIALFTFGIIVRLFAYALKGFAPKGQPPLK